MPHKLEIGQTVISTVYIREFVAVYEVVRLMPEDVTGEPQYRLRNTTSGVEIVSRECGVTPYRSDTTSPGRY